MTVNGRLKKKKKSKYWYCVAYWTDERGEQRFKERSSKLEHEKNTKRKAEAMLKTFVLEVEEELNKAAESKAENAFHNIEMMNLAAYALLWLNTIEGSVDEVTFEWYSNIINKHIVPYFTLHKVLVGEVSQEILQAYFNEKKKSGKLHGKGGLAPTTLKSHKTVLGEILKMAYTAHGKFNPIQNVRIPRKQSNTASFYSTQQCNELLEAIKDDSIYWLVKATLLLGLRRSEVLGLQWDAIDFENQTIEIKRTVVRKVNGDICHKQKTKSLSSARTYHMPDIILKLLQDVREEEKSNRKFFGNTYIDNQYIFKWSNGRLYDPAWVSREFAKLLKKYDLPIIRFHDLRHPYVKPTTKDFLSFLKFVCHGLVCGLSHRKMLENITKFDFCVTLL